MEHTTPDLPEAFSHAVIVQVAMDEEAAPLLEKTIEAAPSYTIGEAKFFPRYHMHQETAHPILLVRSKIGLVNAASATSFALSQIKHPSAILCGGTAGGLHQNVNVGDIIIGTQYTYTDADATAFGYERGQVPSMPTYYDSNTELLENTRTIETESTHPVKIGLMLAGGSFVTTHNVKDTREVFPSALSTDMETTAIAQVCYSHRVPFIAIRCVSDLCGPAADQDFHLSMDIVAPRSAQYILHMIEKIKK
ncbi:5'-methylthioadenosine/adenosylhomocysteine nucleosidase [Rothia sp. P6271]|uniref:5'-methylthioadenosine/adenosylhomocysteine nucleosidase n=1 Tax=unclassified Rothia (in: high G+C Gram-positive bacteria) TaxID=2689056 RepID=UPI003ACBB760